MERKEPVRKRSILYLTAVVMAIWTADFQTARTKSQDDNLISRLKVNISRIEHRIRKLAEFGRTAQDGVSRLAFSEEDIQGRNYVISLMKDAGLDVRIDEAGNVVGRSQGQNPAFPSIMFGSHTDTVPNGGKFDGALGVVGAIECAQVLHENGVQTKHPLEVIVFADEEGGTIGSRALTGVLLPEAFDVASQSGKTIREGLKAIGGEPDRIEKAVRNKGDVKAFLELHIEQGGILHSKNIPIGIVEGIVGINRWDVVIEGFANHAGTTPMKMRQDALLAAAELIVAIRQIVTSMPGLQVGTVGRIKAEPGAPNVVPGQAVMCLELRDLSSGKIQSLFDQIQKKAYAIAEKTSTKISFSLLDAPALPALMDPRTQKLILQSAQELGLSTFRMPSGAGHDAQNMARIAPAGMIFVPSVGGISHSPQEFTRIEDIHNGVNVLLRTILKIDQL